MRLQIASHERCLPRHLGLIVVLAGKLLSPLSRCLSNALFLGVEPWPNWHKDIIRATVLRRSGTWSSLKLPYEAQIGRHYHLFNNNESNAPLVLQPRVLLTALCQAQSQNARQWPCLVGLNLPVAIDNDSCWQLQTTSGAKMTQESSLCSSACTTPK